jgi:rod shape-determining protein MreD
MAYLFVPLALYASLVAQTALRFGGAGHWTPNLMLLVGLAASRGRGGVVWAAGAGLLCDAMAGRPLGVTMLTATLAAALLGRLGVKSAHRPVWRVSLGAFVSVTAVEAWARIFTATVVAEPDLKAELLVALQIAFTTACVASIIPLAAWCVSSLRRPARSSRGVFGLSGASS